MGLDKILPVKHLPRHLKGLGTHSNRQRDAAMAHDVVLLPAVLGLPHQEELS